jgi:hypothetical protein
MSDRFNSLTVALTKDIRDDDAEWIINAIRMIKGVANVTGNVVDHNSYAASSRWKTKAREKIYQVLKEIDDLAD